MNKIFRVFLLLGLMSFVISCSEDRLDLGPIVEESYEGKVFSMDDLQKLLNNTYGTIGSASGMGANAIIYGELMSDNAFISIANDGYYVSTNAMNFTDASGEASGSWGQYYAAIRNANLIIFGEKEEEIDLSSEEYRSIIGQAHLIKGLAYFMLAQYFSPSPALGMDSPYGIVLKQEEWNPLDIKQRSSLQETYEAIIYEYERAIDRLPATAPNKYTFTKTTGNFLLAKAHLHFGNNAKAIEYANAVINNSPAQFQFIDNEAYVDYFSADDNEGLQENQPETIWEFPQTANFNFQVNAHPGVFFANNGQHRSIVYRNSFKDTFPDSDVRKNLFGAAGPAGDEPRGLFIKKWQRKSDEGPFTQDVKIFRMTEAKFILWEAMAKSGNGGAALAEVNAFAESRGGSAHSGDALDAVLAEKRKEFYGEGTRYYDLKRNLKSIVKESNCAINCTIDANDKLFVFPIPVAEMQMNPTMQQYPGY